MVEPWRAQWDVREAHLRQVIRILQKMPQTVTDSYGRTHKASLNEYNVALALEKRELEFEFQVEYFSGRRIRGGQVLDFLVYDPFPIGLQVYGEYWHEGMMASDDQYKLNILTQALGKPPEIIWGKESETPDEALAACRAIFR